MRRIAIAFLAIVWTAAMGAPAAAQDQSQPRKTYDIFEIMDRFMVSNSAASRCYDPAPGELKDFRVQYLNLVIRVQMEIKNKRPDATQEQLMNVVKTRADALDARVAGLIDDKGCDHEAVQQLVELFKFHASIDLMRPPETN